MNPVSNADFAVFVGCLVAGVFALDRVLSVVIQWRALFAKPAGGNDRPITAIELNRVHLHLRQVELNVCAIMTKMGLHPKQGWEVESPEDGNG